MTDERWSWINNGGSIVREGGVSVSERTEDCVSKQNEEKLEMYVSWYDIREEIRTEVSDLQYEPSKWVNDTRLYRVKKVTVYRKVIFYVVSNREVR